MPFRCAAPPSSVGAGILLQSTSSRFFWFIASSPRPHQAALLPAPVALFLGLTLVMQLLALGDRELKLRAAPLVKVKLERDQRHALAIDGADQLVDLPAVQQQFSRTLRLVVEAITLEIFRDIGVDQPDLAVLGI